MKVVLQLAAICLLLSSAADARLDPQSFSALSFRQHPGAQLPLSADLRDEAGAPVTFASTFGGRPAVVVLEYLRCRNLCSLVLRGATTAMARAGLTPGKDANLIAISIDPRDTSADAAAARATYSRSFADPAAAADGLRFLTGSPEQVSRIAAAVGFPYRFDQQSDQFAHPAGFVVTTPTGRISRYVLGLDPSPASLKKAVAEAARNEVKPAAHPLLCLCFGYDPDEGSVAALTWRLVQWTSFSLALGFAGLIGVLMLRRRAA